MNLTIAIPSYNKEKTIQRCLQSILAEKDISTKVILVDNKSTDTTYTIAKAYEPQITCYQNETNLGMANNWNRCIELCDTEWLMIFHADDEMVPGALSHYETFSKKYPSVALIHANSYSVNEGSYTTKEYHKKNQAPFWNAGLEAMKCHYGVCSAVLVKKNVYDKLGLFIESLSSDAEMWSRIASQHDVGFIDEPTVIYHISKTSTGFEGLIKRNVMEIKKDWDNLYQTISTHYPTEALRQEFLATYYKNCPGSYYAIAKANVKVGNILKAFHVLLVIIWYYKGLIPLLGFIRDDIKRYILKRKKNIL